MLYKVSRQWWDVLARPEITCAGFECVAGCSRTNTISEAFYPCGPAMGDGEDYHDQFLAWTPDGEHLSTFSITRQSGVRVTYSLHGESNLGRRCNNGTQLRMIVDANPGYGARFGFHADVSLRMGSTHIVFSTCEFLTERAYPLTQELIQFDLSTTMRLLSLTLTAPGKQAADGERIP